MIMKLKFLIILLLITNIAKSAHIIGGEMRYTYISAGVNPNSKIYRITLILFRGDDPSGAPFAPSYVIGIFNNDNGSKIIGSAANNNWSVTMDGMTRLVYRVFRSFYQPVFKELPH